MFQPVSGNLQFYSKYKAVENAFYRPGFKNLVRHKLFI